MSAKEQENKSGASPSPGDDGVAIRTPKMPWYKQLFAVKDTIIIVLTPLLFLPVFIYSTSRATRCAYSVLIIAVYWMTECLPMSVTALLPVVLMTWLGVMDSKEICKNYLKDANFLFLGGLLIAVAVEKWGLHKRVALRVLMLVGSKPVWITFGFMAVTGFLSMWLANIATTAMMIPIAAAVLKELDAHRKHLRELKRTDDDIEMKLLSVDESKALAKVDDNKIRTAVEMDGGAKNTGNEEQVPLKVDADFQKIYAKEDSEFRNFACALKLSVTYASNVGGLGTIIGCGPNIVFKGQTESIYGPNTGLNFFSFFMFAFPLMMILLPLSWLTLMFVFIGPKKAFCSQEKEESGEMSANAVIRREYQKLGRMTWPEVWVTILFLILAFLWITKDPQFVPGWETIMPYKYVTDSSVAVTVAIFMFILPSKPPNYLCFRNKSDKRAPGPAPAILDWPTVHKEMQWGVLLLLGGGFAIADACKESELSIAIGSFLSFFKFLPPWALVLFVSVIAVIATTFTSNVACATLLLPISAELANGVGIHPIYIMFPVTMAVSFSYLLPVSTPSNAIIFAYGDVTVPDMLKVGSISCVLHILILQLAINTWGRAIFNLDEYPYWAPSLFENNPINGTLAADFNGTSPLSLFVTTVSSLG